jgi:tetratricopeptide (TPR) repeat protein
MRLLAMLVVAVALLLPATPRPAHAAPTADALFEEGKRAFRLGKYDEAIDRWQRAYEQRGDAVFLFNIAQAYRAKKEYERAIFFYESYLKDAKDAPNRAKVEERVVELRGLLEEQQRQEGKPPTGPLTPERGETGAPASDGAATRALKPPAPDAARPPDEAPAPRRSLAAPLIVGGAAVVLLGTALGFELWGNSTYDQAKAEPDPDTRNSLWQSANTKRYIAEGLAVAGIAGGGIAVYLYFHNRAHRADATTAGRAGQASRLLVEPMVGKAGAGVQLVGRF